MFGEIETVIGEVFGSILSAGAQDMSFVQARSVLDDDSYDMNHAVEKYLLSGKVTPEVRALLTGVEARKTVQRWAGPAAAAGASIDGGQTPDVIEFFKGFAQRLRALHQLPSKQRPELLRKRLQGMIHGDLNGANILIDSESIVWLIDFAFSGEGPVMEDLCKLETALLVEYTPLRADATGTTETPTLPQSPAAAAPNRAGLTATQDGGAAEADMLRVVEALTHADVGEHLPPLSSLGLDCDAAGSAVLDQVWSAVARLRQHGPSYCARDANPLYLHAGRLFHALKALSFRDISIAQKRVALAAALGHAARIMELLQITAVGKPARRRAVNSARAGQASNNAEEHVAMARQTLARERVKYLTGLGAKECFFVDPISRSKLSVMDQCVELELTAEDEDDAAKNMKQQHQHQQHQQQQGPKVVAAAATVVVPAAQSVNSGNLRGAALHELLEALQAVMGECSRACSADRSFVDKASVQAALSGPRGAEVRAAAARVGLKVDPAFAASLFSWGGEEWDVVPLADVLNVALPRLAAQQGADDALRQLILEQQLDALVRESPPREDLAYLRKIGTLMPPSFDAVESRRLVVLGAPASGKSVLLRKMLVYGSLVQNFRRESCLVPLRVLLIDLGRLIARDGLTAKDDLLRVYLDDKFGRFSAKTEFLKRALAGGRALLLLDGLDEAGPSAQAVMGWLSGFLRDNFAQRVVLTSREAGFAEHMPVMLSQGFKVTKVNQLSEEMINEIVAKRVLFTHASETGEGGAPTPAQQEATVAFLQTQLRQPEYANLAQNPLMLSLLIHVLSLRQSLPRAAVTDTVARQRSLADLSPAVLANLSLCIGIGIGAAATGPNPSVSLHLVAAGVAEGGDAASASGGDQQPLTRTKLFEIAIEQMLRRSAQKYSRRSTLEDKTIQRHFELLDTPSATKLLRMIALDAHERCSRDISVANMTAVLLSKLDDIVAQVRSGLTGADDEPREVGHESIVGVFNALQRCISRNLVPLFQRRDLVPPSSGAGSGQAAARGQAATPSPKGGSGGAAAGERKEGGALADERDRVVMFAHLTFQEHLAAECIAETLLDIAGPGIEYIKSEGLKAAMVERVMSQGAFFKTVRRLFGGSNLESPWWHEVFMASCQLLSERVDRPGPVVLRAVFRLLFNPAESGQSSEGCIVLATQTALERLWLAMASAGSCVVFHELFAVLCPSEESEAIPSRFALLRTVDASDNNCAHLAAERNRVELLKLVIQRLSSANDTRKLLLESKNNHGWAACNVAMVSNNLQCYRLLTETRGDQDITEESRQLWNQPPILLAVKRRDHRAVRELLAQDPPQALATGASGLTPAMWAAILDDLEMLKIVAGDAPAAAALPATATPAASPPATATALGAASGAASVGRGLGNSGIPVGTRRGNTPLSFAVEHNSLLCARFLLKAGVPPTWRNSRNDSLMLIATSFGFNEMAMLLIEHGCNVAESIVVSAIQGRIGFVKKLAGMFDEKRRKAVLNEHVDIGVTALAAACVAGHKDMVECLLGLGAEMDQAINVPNGVSSLQIATHNGFADIMELLLKRGANVNACRGKGHRTALSIALQRAPTDPLRADLVALLERYGAKDTDTMTPQEIEDNSRSYQTSFPDKAQQYESFNAARNALERAERSHS